MQSLAAGRKGPPAKSCDLTSVAWIAGKADRNSSAKTLTKTRFADMVPMIDLIRDAALFFVSAIPLRKSDAKRPGMHSNAKRWNEAVTALTK